MSVIALDQELKKFEEIIERVKSNKTYSITLNFKDRKIPRNPRPNPDIWVNAAVKSKLCHIGDTTK